MVVVNICYYVGARDESPDKTGFAHLFEHLMFNGTKAVPNFDAPLQMAGGENNAFTNNDITNFYCTVPANNLEVPLWLESDRMTNIRFTKKAVDVQRKVVVEEFKETCLTEPYGDVWHHLSELAYKVHPYQWPVIGKTPEHISNAPLEDVKAFYETYYCPNNAVLVLSGNTTLAAARPLVEKWFGGIPAGKPVQRFLPAEPPQVQLERRLLRANQNAPSDAVYLAFHIPSRVDVDFYGVDLLSDILGNGPSSRLYRRLMKEQELFSSIDCYISGTIDPGLIIIEGKPSDGVGNERALAAIWEELEHLKTDGIDERELQKIKNKAESTLQFTEMTVLSKAIDLAFFEILGNAELINQEPHLYQRVTREQIHALANRIFTADNCSEVIYEADAEVAQ